MHGRSRRTRAWQGHAHARGHTTRMRVATNRAGILLAIMRRGRMFAKLVATRVCVTLPRAYACPCLTQAQKSDH